MLRLKKTNNDGSQIHLKKIISYLLICFLVLITPHRAFLQENGNLEFEGITTPYQTIEVGCSIVGVIDKMNVDRSDFVDKNDILCTLEAHVEKAKIELARARLEMLDTSIALQKINYNFAQREFNRKNTLHEKDAISLFERDEAETNMKIANKKIDEVIAQKRIAQVEAKQAEAIVNRMIINSPIAGVVVERYLTSGELVNEQPILKLAQLNPLYVETIVPANHWGKIKKHMKAVILPEIPLKGDFEGMVKIVDQIIDAESGMFGVRIELPNPDYTLPAGLKCRLYFIQVRT